MKSKISIILFMVTCLISLTNSCKKNDSTPVITGQNFQGGIVGYILKPGDIGYNANVQHGLIAAPSDQSTGIAWWNGTYTITGATDSAMGTGKSNTALIIASQGTGNYAATVCTAYRGGGYTDWYLPSKDELNKLYLNMASIGGFSGYYYWSSTEYNNTDVWVEFFVSGNQNFSVAYKHYTTLSVRAVRGF